MATASISRATPHLLLALCPLLFAQCTSLDRAVSLAPQDEVLVELTQPPAKEVRREVRQSIVNATAVDKAKFYNSRRTDQMTKVVSLERMQLLLDALATGGFFEHATTRQLTVGRSTIKVSINGEELIWERNVPQWAAISQQTAVERAHQFTLCATAFHDLYNATKAYRTGVGLNTVLEEHREQMQGRGGKR